MEPHTSSGSKSEDTLDGITYYSSSRTQKRLWVDRFFGLFCAKSFIHKENEKTKSCEALEDGASLSTWSCPWILPVYVVSNQHEADKHPITKIAKCTIDTGNLQGNIVSREFVEKVLGFASSSFEKLTKEEEAGATGITGEPHIPQGAIHLTWYHKNSTRVFRDMRFLISPARHCDLIIGAWSIQKDKILDVPCLAVGDDRPSQRSDPIGYHGPAHQDEDLRTLEVIDHDVWKEMRKRRNKKKDLGSEATTHDIDRVTQSEAEVDVVGWLLINYEIAITNKEGGKTPRLAEATNNWNEINFRWNVMRPPIRDRLDKSYEKLMKLLNLADGRHDFGGKSNDNDL